MCVCVCVFSEGWGVLEISEMGGYPKWGIVFEIGGLNPFKNYGNLMLKNIIFLPLILRLRKSRGKLNFL